MQAHVVIRRVTSDALLRDEYMWAEDETIDFPGTGLMNGLDVPDWLGDTHQIAVERAIAEFRAARPVIIESGGGKFLAFPFEGLSDVLLTACRTQYQGDVRIVVPNTFGDGRDAQPSAVHLTPLTAGTAASFVQSKRGLKNSYAPAYAVTSIAAGRGDKVALALSAISFLLPAVAVLTLEAGERAPANAVAVDAAWIASYRDREAAALHIVTRAPVPLEGAENCEFVVFRGGDGFRDQIAVIVGNPPKGQPVLVRLHSACLTGDLFGSLKCDCGEQLRGTVRIMAEQGGGVVLYLDQEGRGNGIANKIRAYALQSEGHDTFEADCMLGFGPDQRRFDFAATMLKQLGFHAVKLMTNNPQKIEALRDAGLDVVSTHRVWARPTAHNVKYLAAKRDKAGHLTGDAPLDGVDLGELSPLSAAKT